MAGRVTEGTTRAWALLDEIGKIVGRDDLAFYAYNSTTRSWNKSRRNSYDALTIGEVSQARPTGIGFDTPGLSGEVKPTIIHQFYVAPFTGCCAFAISTSATTMHPYQRKGINHIGIQIRKAIAYLHGYSGLICTDVATNEPSLKTIKKAGFRPLVENFVNNRTKNKVNMYICELP